MLEVHLRAGVGTIDAPLFGRDGRAFTKDLKLHEMISGWAAKAGISGQVVTKDLRSTFATHASEQLGPRFAQHSLGHRSLELTVRRYAALRDSTLAEQARGLRMLSDGALTGSHARNEVVVGEMQNNEGNQETERRAMRNSNPRPLAPEANTFRPKSGGSGGQARSAEGGDGQRWPGSSRGVGSGGFRWPEFSTRVLTALDDLRCAGLLGFTPADGARKHIHPHHQPGVLP